MALQVLKGRITGYKRTRGEASFVFTEDDREGLGVIAIAAGLAGLSGQAVSTASSAASTEEDADYLEFEINGKRVSGWVWRSPFREGDAVEVIAEWQDHHFEICAIARPTDRLVAMYPHCSRGRSSHWRNAWKWWLLGTTGFLILGGAGELYMRVFHGGTMFLDETGPFVVKIFAGFFFPIFALMTWSLARKWMPFVRLSEKVFTALGWDNPSKIDLVKSSKAQRRPEDPPEYGVFYFRY